MRVSEKRVETALIIFVVVHFLIFSYLSLVKYYTFKATAWDLGVFAQSFHTTVTNTGFFYNNLELGSHFHVHFSPFLLLLVPFYAVFQNPATLLVLQALAASIAAVPLYFLAAQELKDKAAGLMTAGLFLIYPPLHGSLMYDFHPEAFIPLFVFSAFYFFKKSKWKTCFIFLLLILSVKEDASLIVISMGVYGVIINLRSLLLKRKITRSFIFSITAVVLGIAWLVLSFNVINFFVCLDGYEGLWNGGYTHHTWNVYGKLGGKGGIIGILSYIITHPIETLNQLLEYPSDKLIFLTVLFTPLVAVPLFDAPSILLFLPVLLENLLASNASHFSLKYHYQLFIIPMVFVATVNGLKKFRLKVEVKTGKIITRRFLYLMVTVSIIVLLFTSSIIWEGVPIFIGHEHRLKQKVISLIFLEQKNPRILTQNDYFPHVCNSLYAYAYWNLTSIDYILIDVNSKWYYVKLVPPDEYVYRYGISWFSFDKMIDKLVNYGKYGLLAQCGSLLLFRREYNGSPVLFSPYNMTFNSRSLYTSSLTVYDPTSLSGEVLWHRAYSNETTFWYGPYITLPPGNYTVTFRLKINRKVSGPILTLDVARNLGKEILVERQLFAQNFSHINAWEDFTLEFKLSKLCSAIEFRGLNPSNSTDIYLDFITVRQTAPTAALNN